MMMPTSKGHLKKQATPISYLNVAFLCGLLFVVVTQLRLNYHVISEQDSSLTTNVQEYQLQQRRWLPSEDDSMSKSAESSSSILKKKVILSKHECGKPWDSLDLSAVRSRLDSSPFIWSVTGGAIYKKYSVDILRQWEKSGLGNVILIALDQESADWICQNGYEAVIFDRPTSSYSVVADAKFQVARDLALAGIDGLLLEMDIFCRSSPLPAMTEQGKEEQHDLVVIGHADLPEFPNIGMYFVRASDRTAYFFQRLIDLLAPSKENERYKDERSWRIKYFDQRFFHHCAFRTPGVILGEEPENPCRNVNVTVSIVKNRIISSHEPPTVTDTTVCIHPLQAKPMMPFINKVVTAASLGFEFDIQRQNERFLKTSSGILEYCDVHSEYGLTAKKWKYNGGSEHARFVYHFSTLVALAKMTNRTLILPREIMSSETTTLPIYSLVDIASVDSAILWRWQNSLHSRATSQLVQVQNSTTAFVNIQDEVSSSEATLIEIDNLFLLPHTKKAEAVMEVANTLRWCLHVSFNFRGGRQELCDHTKSQSFL